jgi:atypical dual specificity phosphatase
LQQEETELLNRNHGNANGTTLLMAYLKHVNKRNYAYIRGRLVDKFKYLRKSSELKDLINDRATLIMNNFIYLGGVHSIRNPFQLRQLGITHVLNTAKGLKLDLNALLANNIKLCCLHAKDKKSYNIRMDFEKAFAFINEAAAQRGRILINCKRGASRSATILIAYLMCAFRLSFLDAFAYVFSLRPHIRPNEGFLLQLKLFEQELRHNSFNYY